MKTLFLRKNTLELTNELNQWIIQQRIIKVKIQQDYNQPIDNLPDCIKIIEFASKPFNQKINKWPKNLKKIIITIHSNIIFDFFPQTIKYLDIYKYDNNIPTLPISLKKLSIHELYVDVDFSSLINLYSLSVFCSMIKINKFPPNLKEFSSYDYDFPIDNLPKNLNWLECPIIENNVILPSKISHLQITAKCEHPIDILPKTLTHLEWIWDFDEDFESKYLPQLPESLHTLKLVNSSDSDFKPIYPSNLRRLIFEDFSHSIVNLPTKLKELSITCSGSNKYLSDEPIMLPNKLKTLMITDGQATIVNLPLTLTNIDIGSGIKFLSEEFILPPKLKNLSIKSYDLVSSSITIPHTLKYLSVHHSDSNDYRKLPSSVKHLTLYIWGSNINTKIGSIPETVETLEINAQEKKNTYH